MWSSSTGRASRRPSGTGPGCRRRSRRDPRRSRWCPGRGPASCSLVVSYCTVVSTGWPPLDPCRDAQAELPFIQPKLSGVEGWFQPIPSRSWALHRMVQPSGFADHAGARGGDIGHGDRDLGSDVQIVGGEHGVGTQDADVDGRRSTVRLDPGRGQDAVDRRPPITKAVGVDRRHVGASLSGARTAAGYHRDALGEVRSDDDSRRACAGWRGNQDRNREDQSCRDPHGITVAAATDRVNLDR